MHILQLACLWLTPALADQPALPPDQLWVVEQALEELEDASSPSASEQPEPFTCLTGSWNTVRAAAARLPPDLQSRWEATSPLAPLQSVQKGDTQLPESCVGRFYTTTTLLQGPHFVVEYRESTGEEAASRLLAALEESYRIATQDLGWFEPEGVDRRPMHVYVDPLRGNIAITASIPCDGQRSVPYLVFGEQLVLGDTYNFVAAHELAHASTMAAPLRHERFWAEASAMWLADEIYPEAEPWVQHLYAYTEAPWIGLNAAGLGAEGDPSLLHHSYAMILWALFLEDLGGPGIIRDTWFDDTQTEVPVARWVPVVVEDMGFEFDEVYPQYLAALSQMSFDTSMKLAPADWTQEVVGLPASGGSEPEVEPQSLGHNLVRFHPEAGAPGQRLVVTVEGDPSADSWQAVLVLDGTAPEEAAVFEMGPDGRGIASVELTGDLGATLVVSPLYSEAKGHRYDWSVADTFAWSWQAELLDPETALQRTTTMPDWWCGYRTLASAGVLSTLAAALFLARRRRRS